MIAKIRVLALTRYAEMGSSSRLRFYQYLPYLQAAGFKVTFCPLLDNAYIDGIYTNRLTVWSILKGYIQRCYNMLLSTTYDIIWVEKECLPWIPSLFEKVLLKYKNSIVDYDDATFHQYDSHPNFIVRAMLSHKIDNVMAAASTVAVGNSYINQHAVTVGAKSIVQLPTVIDLKKYGTCEYVSNKKIVIGWIGSPTTAKFLRLIKPALVQVAQLRSVQFVAVGARADQVADLGVQAITWTEDTEVHAVKGFDIGIMPLPDAAFERGKCGYKLLQYMACGKPVIASPVGANLDIVMPSKNGLLASSQEEWVFAMCHLIDDEALRFELGTNGRQHVEDSYSLEPAAKKLAGLFNALTKQADTVAA